jgi:hypothetical protein
MTTNVIRVIAALALSSAAAARQFDRIPIPLPQGHVIQELAINQQNQALVTECDTATVPQCTAFLWIPGREGTRTILSYESGSYDHFLLNDTGQVAALRIQHPASAVNTVVLWSDWDGWHEVAQIPTSGTIRRFTNFGELLGTNERRIFYATRAFGLEYADAVQPDNPPANFTVNDSNKHGILAGTLELQLPSCSTLHRVRHAARWAPRAGAQDLEPRNSPWNICVNESVGLATNLHGDVAGILYGPGGHDQHPFLWTEKNGLQDLGQTFGRLGGRVLLNDKRELAGWWIVATAGIRSYFWSQSTEFRDIGYLEGIPGASWSTYAEHLNKHGEVVGRSGNHAFFWSEKTGIVDLGLGSALQVNDHGLIRGSVETGSGSATEPRVWIIR